MFCVVICILFSEDKMISFMLKYFFIFFCSTYLFEKMQNYSLNFKKFITSLLFSFISSFAMYFINENWRFLTLITIVLFLIVFHHIVYKNNINNSLTFTSISVGVSYISYTISSFVVAPFCYLLLNDINRNLLNNISILTIGLFQTLLCYLLFRVKRLKKGIEIYGPKIASDSGVFISVVIILVASLFDNQNNNDIIKSIILFCVLLVGLLLFLWIKRYIQNIYLEKVHNRNIEILENSLLEQQEINSKLTKSNEELSSIIHRDNKLIPAMQSAVEEILACNSPDEQKEKSKLLLPQLKAMSSQRSTILSDYENLHKVLVQTGILSIDASLKYLMKRANNDGISFELSVTCDLKEFVKDLICENDLNTLILDLCENALIAVRETKIKNVLVVFGIENESFIISVYDSGLPFESKVIENLGKKRITTHKATGGSGIGLMTTSELLRKHNASFVIDENIDNDSYAKKVSVIFDGLSQCRVVTATDKITRPL